MNKPSLLSAVLVAFFLMTRMTYGAAVIEQSTDEMRWPGNQISYAVCTCDSAGNAAPYCTASQCVAAPDLVNEGIRIWNDQAGSILRLVPKDANNSTTPYLLYVSQEERSGNQSDAFCYTQVGHNGRNEPHLVVIGDRCVAQKGSSLPKSVIHETGHAVGLQHEQQRTDRDSFVEVVFPSSTANEALGQSGRMCSRTQQEKCQFQSVAFPPMRLYTYGRDVGAYDFQSVMHYPFYTLPTLCEALPQSENKACITPTQTGRQQLQAAGIQESKVGSFNMLSSGDLDAIRMLYGP